MARCRKRTIAHSALAGSELRTALYSDTTGGKVTVRGDTKRSALYGYRTHARRPNGGGTLAPLMVLATSIRVQRLFDQKLLPAHRPYSEARAMGYHTQRRDMWRPARSAGSSRTKPQCLALAGELRYPSRRNPQTTIATVVVSSSSHRFIGQLFGPRWRLTEHRRGEVVDRGAQPL